MKMAKSCEMQCLSAITWPDIGNRTLLGREYKRKKNLNDNQGERRKPEQLWRLEMETMKAVVHKESRCDRNRQMARLEISIGTQVTNMAENDDLYKFKA